MTVKDLLLEIGTEELPARFIGPAIDQLKAEAEGRLAAAGLAFRDVAVFGTPRRLTFLARGLPEKSPDETQTLLGPPAQAAKDASGAWSAAAAGFARSVGLKPEQLEAIAGPKGDRLGTRRLKKGLPAAKILPELLPELIRALRFPKSMVWEESRFGFARPIRWIAAVFGRRPLRFKLAGVTAGSHTFGLQGIQPARLSIAQPHRYLEILRNHCVLADPRERRKVLRQALEQSARRLKGQVLAPPELLEEVVNLVEHPVAVQGRFDEKYLSLPDKILISVMQKHQKFFAVASPPSSGAEPVSEETSGAGKLMNHFVAVRNGFSENLETVREGYERVLSARLADARFFFNQDRKKRLEEFAAGLSGVGFHEKLGSMADKSARVGALGDEIGAHLRWEPGLRKRLERAAGLCKADLLTYVVYEFPELQGLMGRLYAALDGEPAEVADAIEQHYWPLTSDGPLPESDLACALALADKLDTLSADFSVGILPTGSADPYGLRKAGTGVVRILLEKGWPLSLEWLAERAISRLKSPKPDLKATLLDFLRTRFENWVAGRGCRQDEIASVTAVDFRDLRDCAARLDALKAMRAQADFEAITAAFKRTANILEQAREKNLFENGRGADPGLLKEAAERELYETFQTLREQLQARLDQRDYGGALSLMTRLKVPIDRFFDTILVMADDASLRTNRLALLSDISALFSRFADFKLLQDTPAPAAAR